MAQETYQEMWRELRLHAPNVPVSLAKHWIRNRYREVQEKHFWSWRLAESQFIVPAVANSGTVAVIHKNRTVTGTGTTFTSDMVGRQFRVKNIAPLYTIEVFNSPTSIDLDLVYGGVTESGQSYQILQAYLTGETDTEHILEIRDTTNNWRLRTSMTQEWLNRVDSQRSATGIPWTLVDLRYGTAFNKGSVEPIVQAVGSGPAPVTSGIYTGRTSSIFTITVTTGGTTTNAVFSWRKDAGLDTTNITTTEATIALQEGVSVSWPTGATYVANDVFTFHVTPGLSVDLPMYELWPYQLAQRAYPYLYVKRVEDLDGANDQLPRTIRGDLLVKGALADLSRWPGTTTQKNLMFNLNLYNSYEAEFQTKIMELEKNDEDTYLRMLMAPYTNLNFAPYDAAFIQSHGPDFYG